MPEVPQQQKDKVTHQQYLDAKNELNELMTRKKLVDRNLAGLENSIYAFEGSYLEDTQHGGNIIRGFDGYINSKADKSRVKYSESDRLFSMSSTTFTKALQIKENPDPESSQDESKRSSSSSKRLNPKSSTSSIISTPSSNVISGSSSSSSRRLLKQQKSSQSKGSDQRPPKKMRLSSTGRDGDGDEDLDV
ncbi:Chromatin modification- protein meaf6 [Mortierella sp. AD011]|nr:Chromatin modification- protein meaf6 [Mortierella sp. AD010]KAF9397466.1 Chromatin modification- protein meaf6 [Mortierella sp. AD011]KAG0003678.1 Chromatin modification- protein meaf6 [Entomortierella chlamydospora]